MADAAALIQSRLGGTVDLRQDVLKPLQSDIAYYRLTDRISSDEDARERYREALKLLDTIAQQEGPPEETITPQADLIDHPARFQKGIL